MRLVFVVLVISVVFAGAGLGWAAREMRGTSPSRARASAIEWLVDEMGFQDAEVLATERFSTLDGYEGPVFGVSSRVAYADYQGNQGAMCWGVIVGVSDGKVIGAVGGEIPWLHC